MPHIILRGSVDLARVRENFSPERADGNGWIVRLKEFYLSTGGRSALVDCTSVRSGFSQDYYVRVEMKGEGLTVRVDPYMRIERNEGVQRAILAVVRVLCRSEEELVVERSNLPPELLAEVTSVESSG